MQYEIQPTSIAVMKYNENTNQIALSTLVNINSNGKLKLNSSRDPGRI